MDSESYEEFFPALPEDVQPLDLAYLPQASIDKRHGGRHLHGHKEDEEESDHHKKGGKGKHGKGKHGKGKHGKGKHGKGKHGCGKHGKGKHHGEKHHSHKMVWCLAIGVALYTALITSFICVFKKFVRAFHSYHNTVALQTRTANMTVEERNKAYLDMNSGCSWKRNMNSGCRW